MNFISYVNVSALERYINSDGQRLTDLVRKWAQLYFPRCGLDESQYTINGVSFRADGGVDGTITANALIDPLGLLDPRTVFQFKAGTTTVADAKTDLEKEPAEGQARVIDLLRSGYKLVWIMGRSRTDVDVKAFEKELTKIVAGIAPTAPAPILVDANRLATCLSQTPTVAVGVVSADGLFVTSDQALNNTPHSLLPRYVPPAYFEGLKADIESFLNDPDQTHCLEYFAGEPGIGKSRALLEVVERIDGLSGLTCYFPSPTNMGAFFNLARQHNWKGICIVDEYTGLGAGQRIDPSTVPDGLKILLIGHSFDTNRTRREYSSKVKPLDEKEIEAVFAEAYPALAAPTRRQAVKYARNNLRLANWLCGEMLAEPTGQLSAATLDRRVAAELDRDHAGQMAIRRLALLPLLVHDDVAEFCQLIRMSADAFIASCQRSAQTSGFVQFNDSVMYVAAPAIAQVALIRSWNEEPGEMKRILSNPGKFFEPMLQMINRLAPGSEKEEMLSFFKLPSASFTVQDLLDGRAGRHFLQLLTAEPSTYLPQLYLLLEQHKEGLEEFPYESNGIGRRDVIWRLRDLAQFEEFFPQCEAIVYWFARKEIPSVYANDASSYWAEWFQAYFDFTEYPYEKRLDLLEERIRTGDEIDHDLILTALSNPFPDVGSSIPSDVVGGRAAPPSLQYIHHRQIAVAAERVPDLLGLLLEVGSPALREKLGDAVESARFSWLEHLASTEPYLKIVLHTLFPVTALQKLIVSTRYYLSLKVTERNKGDRQMEHRDAMHKALLDKIDDLDPLIDVLMLADHGFYSESEESDLAKAEKRVLQRCAQSEEFLLRSIAVLNDPDRHGGWRLGKALSSKIGRNIFDRVLSKFEARGPSSFALALIAGYAALHPATVEELIKRGHAMESENPGWATAIYQVLGDDVYLTEAARMLSDTDISSAYFYSLWPRISLPLSGPSTKFLEAIELRLDSGDAEAVGLALGLAQVFRKDAPGDETGQTLALQAFLKYRPERRQSHDHDWQKIGLWLSQLYPNEVISHCAAQGHSEHSAATAVLRELAHDNSRLILDALVPKLKTPYEAPFLLYGSLTMVFAKIDVATFGDWLRGQPFEVARTVAGQLPKPFLDDQGHALVPPITRAFWEQHNAGHEGFEELLSQFRAQTFNTGVFWGHGVELFQSRISIARQLKVDPNASIRKWAEGFLAESEAHLADAKKSADLDNAVRETEL